MEQAIDNSDLTIRDQVFPGDIETVRTITRATGFFHEAEVEIAVELVEERLAKGLKSGYHYLFAEREGKVTGFTTFGPIGCTKASFDLYWIVVHPDYQGRQIGKQLLCLAEEKIKQLGGRRIYIETSSRELYRPTQGFYLKNGYRQEAVIEDFYDEDDSRLIYVKVI
jgi:ribosomal protein S18 acetylase RimI-like enzyme